MKFFDTIRANFARFMSGRYGADTLGQHMIFGALAMTIIGSLTGLSFLSLMADALIVLALFRMLSKNRYKRAQENQDYLAKTLKARQNASEWMNRMKNRKKYRYFSCPKCKMRLRVPRGVGNVTTTCKGCGEKFDKKA